MINPIETAKYDFKQALNKGRILSFEDLKINVIEEDFLDYHHLLQNWYLAITSFTFLPKDLQKLEEVFIHGSLDIVLKSRKKEENYSIDITQKDLEIAYEILALKEKVNWNIREPFASFYTQLQNTSVRVSLIHRSASPSDTSKMFIRVLNTQTIPINSYLNDTPFLKDIINNKKNIIISGATGSGKTTFINTLLSEISAEEHIIIIEDTKELLAPNQYTTSLLTDEENDKKTMNEFLKYSLRMSPDRIVLGEIRAKEVESSLLAMNTGHNGFLTTVHANSAKDAIHRLALLFKIYSSKDLSFSLILKLISDNIDYVIHLQDKKIIEVIEVFGAHQENILFEKLHLS